MENQNLSLYKEVETSALAGLAGDQISEGKELIKAIVNDWIEQAEGLDLDLVIKIGREELDEALEGQDPQERLQTLRNAVLVRQVDKLSARSLALALAVAKGEKAVESGTDEARAVTVRVDELLPAVHALQDSELKRRLSRELADSDLESRYVLAGGEGIMSIRLNHSLR